MLKTPAPIPETNDPLADGAASQRRLRFFRVGLPSPWTLLCLVISVVVALPVLVVLYSLTQDSQGDWAHLAETRLPGYLKNTAIIAVSVCAICAVVGTTTAWLVTTCDFPGRRLLAWALILPLAVPAYLAAYAYTDLLQFAGPVQAWLRDTYGWGRGDYWFPDLRTRAGAIVILSATLYPYVYLAARTAFVEQSANAMEAARTLGRGPWHAFLTVALPLARPSIAAGTALVLMETLADFGAVDYCAVDTLATGVYHTWRSLENPTAAAQLASMLLGIVVLAIAIETIARRRARHHQLSTRLQRVKRQRLGLFGSLAAFAVCALPILAGFALPAGVFLHMAITTGDDRAWEVAVDHGRNSLMLASIACIAAMILAVLVAYAHRLSRGPVTALAARLAGTGYALPGTVLGLGLLIPLTWMDFKIYELTEALSDKWGIDLFAYVYGKEPETYLILSGTVFAVLLGYQTRFLGVALAMIQSAFGRVKPSLDDAARTLGASRAWVVLRVHVPMLSVSIFAAGLLVFVDVVKELPATLMLRPFNFETLAVRTYQMASDERLETASFSALLIIAIGLIPVIVLTFLLSDRRRDKPDH
ncbi:MAG: iron ABC transporter permease [Planctomycetota bacterium]